MALLEIPTESTNECLSH